MDQAVTESVPPELKLIAEVEAWTLLWAAMVWLDKFHWGQWIAFIGDNQVAIALLNKGWSPSPRLRHIARTF